MEEVTATLNIHSSEKVTFEIYFFFIKQRRYRVEEASHSAVPFSHRQLCHILPAINLVELLLNMTNKKEKPIFTLLL